MKMLFSKTEEGRRPVRLAVTAAALGVIACFGAAFKFADEDPQSVQQMAVR